MSVRNCQKFKMSWLLTPNMASLQQGYFQNLSKSSGPGRSVNFAQLSILQGIARFHQDKACCSIFGLNDPA